MISSSEIRARARGVLGNNIFSNSWLYALLAELIIGAIGAALGVTGVGAFILGGTLSCSLAFYYQGRVRGTVGHGDFIALVDGAKQDIAGSIITGILYSVFIALWSMLLIIPGIIKSFSYAMTFYIKNDHPEYSANDAITESRRMMDGHKMEYFILQLSFIGWWIVGALCLGVGTIWVQSYVSAANAIFYEELKANYIPAATFGPGNADNNDSSSII